MAKKTIFSIGFLFFFIALVGASRIRAFSSGEEALKPLWNIEEIAVGKFRFYLPLVLNYVYQGSEIGLWNETTPIPIPSSTPFVRGQQLIFHNGYVYLFGGQNESDATLTNVYHSAINPNGTLAGWVETTSLPGEYADHVVVKSGDYVYLITGAAGSSDVFFAPINSDGSIGAWVSTASLEPSRQNFASVAYGNFVYASGGNSGGTQNFVQFTSVNSDGTLNPWVDTTVLPGLIEGHTMIAYGGYLYVFGGLNKSNPALTDVYYSAINPDGTLAGWNATTSLPQEIIGFSTFEHNGYVHLLGGGIHSYYTRILEDHSLDVWQTTTILPTLLFGLRTGAINGYVYALGGTDFGSYKDTVYYAVLEASDK